MFGGLGSESARKTLFAFAGVVVLAAVVAALWGLYLLLSHLQWVS